MPITKKELEQLKEAKQLASELGLSMTSIRGEGMWLRYRVRTTKGKDGECVCRGYISDVLRALRARRQAKDRQP
jgi:hypothetical protein